MRDAQEMPRCVLSNDIGYIQKQYLSPKVIVLISTLAGKETFRGYLMGLGFQGKESLF